MPSPPPLFSILDYAVDGYQSQQELIAAFVEVQERWVRFYPGYRSARLFGSLDGRRVFNVVEWASEDDFRRFDGTLDADGRWAALQAAITGVSGTVEARMTGAPRFTVVAEVGPGPQRVD